MLTEAFISHNTSERLRVKVPGKKGDASYFSALASRFSGLPGVRHVEANPITGSVLLLIEPRQGIELEGQGIYRGATRPAQPCICRSARNGNLSAQYREYYRSCLVRSLLVRDDYSILRPAPCLKDRRLVLEETRERK